MNDVYDYEKEKREALEAGEYALRSLKDAMRELDSARNWGVMDIIGGGFISTMMKRSKMNSAKKSIEQARYALRNFSKELRDVDQMANLHIDTEDFISFADWFFDGFLVDMMVQSRINEAREQVYSTICRVETILAGLK